ncbi:hypothetical protein FQA39_LY13476 [Lamprigera yunnana]|nr:hypothetical protein FQA39_LY13476 [Lamprigera yunnana]
MDREPKNYNYNSLWKKIVDKVTDVQFTPSIYVINPRPCNSEEFVNRDTFSNKNEDDFRITSTHNKSKPTFSHHDLSSSTRYNASNRFVLNKPRLFNQVLTAISIALVSLVTGFVSAYTSSATENIKSDLEVSDKQISWVGGLVPLGALVGGLIGGQLIDYIGRRLTILISNALFLLCWICIALAPSIEYLFIARGITGFSVGVASLAMPIYLGEVVEPKVRGTLGLFPTAFGNIGILASFLAGTYLSWKNLAWVGAALSIPFFFLVCIIPETPRWYLLRSNRIKALDSLQWLRGSNTDVKVEFFELVSAQSEKSDRCCGATNGLLNNLKPLIIALGLMFFQQLSGITAVIYYTNDIFQMSESTIDKNLSTVVVGIVNFVSTFVATVLIDRLGRKVLLYVSSICMILTLSVLGAYFYLVEKHIDTSSYGWVPLVSFIIYVLGFSLGFGPVPWLMLGEIFTIPVKGVAGSIVTAFHWICTFVVTKTFTDVIEAIGPHGTFWLYGIMCGISLVFVFILVPETKGKSLQDIEAIIKLRKSNKYVGPA